MKNKFSAFFSRLFNPGVNGEKALTPSRLGVIGGFAGPDTTSSYLSGNIIIDAIRKEKYVCEGYANNDIVYSIIRLILNKVKVAPWGWYKIKDEKAYAEYQTAIKSMSSKDYEKAYGDKAASQLGHDFKKMAALQTKALEAYNASGFRAGKLADLIKYPNSVQSWSDMVEEGCGFKLITGDKFRIADIHEGPLTKGLPAEINNLASQHMLIITEANRFPLRAGSFRYQCGVQVNYTKEEMLHEKYFNPLWDATGSHLYGLSPIKAAWMRIQRTNKAQQSQAASFENGGADGAMWPRDKEFAEYLANKNIDALDQTKSSIRNAIGGGYRKKGDIAVLTSGPWEYERLRLSPVDQAIIAAEQWDMPMLCNVWQVPSQLMNDPFNKIQANAVSGEKALTLRCAWPLLVDERDNMNRKFQTDWGLKGENIVLDFDATVFTELEEDKKSQTEWLKDAYWYTPNQKLAIQGEPIDETDPNMNRRWIPSNLIPMDDATTERIDPNEFLNS